MSDDKNDIFISYSHSDKGFVHQLANDLKAKGVKVWLDELNIDPGGNVVRAINEGIGHSSHMLVLLSRKSMQSNWVQEEWSAKYNEEVRKNSIKVIPTIIDDLEPEEIPPVLAGKKYINFIYDYEGEIGNLSNFLLRKRKEQVENETVDLMKEKMLSSIDDGSVYPEASKDATVKNIKQKIAKAKEKNWTSKRIIDVVIREVDYRYDKSVSSLRAAEEKNEKDPNEFNMSMVVLSSMTHTPIEIFRDKLIYISKQDSNPDEILEEIELELECQTEKRR